jgi:hypothetical protein
MGCAQATTEGMPQLQDPQMEVAAQMTAVDLAEVVLEVDLKVFGFDFVVYSNCI